MTFEKRINVRVDEELYKVVTELSELHNITRSELMRIAVTDNIKRLEKKKTYTREEFEILINTINLVANNIKNLEIELNKIGININQLTKLVNTSYNTELITRNQSLLQRTNNRLLNTEYELKELSKKIWEVV